MRSGYSRYDDDGSASSSLFLDDGHPSWSASDSSSSWSSFPSRCRAACSRDNALLWPLVSISLLAFLFLILTIAGYSRSLSPSSSPSTGWPSSSPLSALIGPPLILPNTEPAVFVTLLQMNDVYELLPLANGTRGGLPRVAYIRSLLLQENPNTLTLLAGDLLSPSALSSAIVNGSALTGRQMISTMSALGLDFACYGNHEFDLTQPQLQQRIAESAFQWLSINTFIPFTSTLFPSNTANPGFVIRNIQGVRLLIFGLTIDSNMGSTNYVSIPNVATSIALAQQLLSSQSGNYDICVALTHWDLDSDIQLVESVAAVNLVLGGHEHANYFLTRGLQWTPILKSDSNDATVYIHRLAYQPSTRKLFIQSHLQIVNQFIPSLASVQAVADYWWQAGMAGFRSQGFEPTAIVCNLGSQLWDGRSEIVRSDRNNTLMHLICVSELISTNATLAIVNSGAVRIDDIIDGGEISQYDVLRILPFSNYLVTGRVNVSLLLQTLNAKDNIPGNGGFLDTCGQLSYRVSDSQWLINNTPLSTLNPSQVFTLATNNYLWSTTPMGGGSLVNQGELMSLAFIAYLNATSCSTTG